jgi:hypothetical protein
MGNQLMQLCSPVCAPGDEGDTPVETPGQRGLVRPAAGERDEVSSGSDEDEQAKRIAKGRY